MSPRRWVNWDQGSPRDNLWEMLDVAERERRREELQRRHNESFMHHTRERRLRSSRTYRTRTTSQRIMAGGSEPSES